MPPKETFHAKHGLRKKAFAIVTRFARHALFPGDALRPRGLFTRGGAGCREPAAERGPPCSPPFRARVTWERAGVIARGSHRLPRGRPSQVRPRSGPSPRVGDRGLRAVRRQERENEREQVIRERVLDSLKLSARRAPQLGRCAWPCVVHSRRMHIQCTCGR